MPLISAANSATNTFLYVNDIELLYRIYKPIILTNSKKLLINSNFFLLGQCILFIRFWDF